MDLNGCLAALCADIDASATSLVPDCTTCDLVLAADAWVPLVRPAIGPYAEGGAYDLPADFKQSPREEDGTLALIPGDAATAAAPRAQVSAIIGLPNHRARIAVQRAASRGIVLHVERLDGFKYTFNNAWASKDEDGLRFSYICQDSMQNKDRHANGFARTIKHLKTADGGVGGSLLADRGPRKPTYDCKGTVSVKFSAKAGSVQVQYRHNAIHSTAAERKAVLPAFVGSGGGGSPALKRKRSGVGWAQTGSPLDGARTQPMEKELSLFDLLVQSAEADAAQQSRHDQPRNANSSWWGNT